MAITNAGTVNKLLSIQVPSDYTRPTVTTFADYDYVRDITLTVLKETVDEADPATTMAAIISNATIGITKQIDDILAADYIATRTVTAYTNWTDLTTNLTGVTKTDPLLTAAVASYVCTVKLYIKTAV
jgi:hypothetical protein